MTSTRRAFLAGAAALAAAPAFGRAAPAFGDAGFRAAVSALEVASRGRFGVAILDRHSGATFAHCGDERFAMCSTFKFVLAAAVLHRVDAGAERLDRGVAVSASDIVANSPITETRVGGTATLGELCAATIARSDNAAANLLLPTVGGLAGLTRFVRATGDRQTRMDRTEPMLNTAIPGDPRDTTTPRAMLMLLDRLAFGATLTPRSRMQLIDWMRATRTADARLRAGLPREWAIASKTGAGANGSDNEVAIIWPPSREPLIVASYITGSALTLAQTNASHARLGTLIAAALRKEGPVDKAAG